MNTGWKRIIVTIAAALGMLLAACAPATTATSNTSAEEQIKSTASETLNQEGQTLTLQNTRNASEQFVITFKTGDGNTTFADAAIDRYNNGVKQDSNQFHVCNLAGWAAGPFAAVIGTEHTTNCYVLTDYPDTIVVKAYPDNHAVVLYTDKFTVKQ